MRSGGGGGAGAHKVEVSTHMGEGNDKKPRGQGQGVSSPSFPPSLPPLPRREITWMEEVLEAQGSLRSGPVALFADRVFENEMNLAVQLTEANYERMLFREALKTGFFDLQVRSLWAHTENDRPCFPDLVYCCTVLYCTVLYCTVLYCSCVVCLALPSSDLFALPPLSSPSLSTCRGWVAAGSGRVPVLVRGPGDAPGPAPALPGAADAAPHARENALPPSHTLPLHSRVIVRYCPVPLYGTVEAAPGAADTAPHARETTLPPSHILPVYLMCLCTVPSCAIVRYRPVPLYSTVLCHCTVPSCVIVGYNGSCIWCTTGVPLQICPHYGEHVWRKVLKKPGQGVRCGWPVAGPTDMTLKASNKYLQVSTLCGGAHRHGTQCVPRG